MIEKYLRVKVHAGARENRLLPRSESALEVWVKEPAENNRANQAVIAILTAHFGRQPGQLYILKGARKPSKIVGIRKAR